MRNFEQTYLQEIFDYNQETGVVIWKRRPRTDFTHASRHRSWCIKHVGYEAGTLDPNSGKLRVSLLESTFFLDKLLWKLATGKDETIYHINGWNVDNRLKNLTPEKNRANPVTRYSGGDIYLTKDRYDRFIIQTHTHAFSIHATHRTARTRMCELAETLQCGWEDLCL